MADSPRPSTRVGRLLLAAFQDDFDPCAPAVGEELAALIDDPASREEAMVVLVMFGLTVLRQLFGQPPDVREITRRLRIARQEIPVTDHLPMREIEAQFRALLGEAWLQDVVDMEKIAAAGVAPVLIWREIVTQCVRETDMDISSLVSVAEANASKEFVAGAGQVVRSYFAAAQRERDPSYPDDPVVDRLRDLLRGE